ERVKVANLHRSLVTYIEQNKQKQPFLLSLSEEVEEIVKQLRERHIEHNRQGYLVTVS
ncbi:unnamed protein product, partial [marine sediment metagenome]